MIRLTIRGCVAYARRVLTAPIQFRCPPVHELQHKGEHAFHASYMLLVGIESSYWYGKVALLCFACIVVGVFTKQTEGHGPPDAEEA